MKFAAKPLFLLLFALAACSSAGTPTSGPSPSASSTASPMASASPSYITAPAIDSSSTPPPSSAQASPAPAESPNFNCVPNNDNVHGTVLDAAGKPVADAEVKMTVTDSGLLEQCPSLTPTTVRTDSQGNYRFAKVIAQARTELTASKAGYASQTRIEVPTSRAGDDAINRYDFKLLAN